MSSRCFGNAHTRLPYSGANPATRRDRLANHSFYKNCRVNIFKMNFPEIVDIALPAAGGGRAKGHRST